MYFTSREKSAICLIGSHVILADGKVAREELALSATLADTLAISNAEMEAACNLPMEEALDILKAMTLSEKKFICSYLGTLIAIDGDINNRERLLWSLISYHCSFPTMSIAEAKQYFFSV